MSNKERVPHQKLLNKLLNRSRVVVYTLKDMLKPYKASIESRIAIVVRPVVFIYKDDNIGVFYG